MLINEGFQQTAPIIPLAYQSDIALQNLLRRVLPASILPEIESKLNEFSIRLAGPIHEAAKLADGTEPTLIQYDNYGKRIDQLNTSEGWRLLKSIATVEGLVAEPYERNYGEWSRVFGMVKGYLFVPESRLVGCPGSMTDGCARVLELNGTKAMKEEVLTRLVSRDPTIAWSAAQWMTERTGGSDISLTETVATPVNTSPSYIAQAGDEFVLNGFKWFSSATDGDVSLALARTSGAGSRGLSLFLVKMRLPNGDMNGIRIHRLKKKWGTKALPTAELELSNCVGQLVGELGRGIPVISSVLNITRIHSALSGVGALRRSINIATAFAKVRKVNGEPGALLSTIELHTSALFAVEVACRAILHFEFGMVALLGRDELLPSKLTAEEAMRLRLLTPVVKAFNAKISVAALPETMVAMGGQGYMVESQIGGLIQDAAVEQIWEGTTATLGLDIVRVIKQTKGKSTKVFIDWAVGILNEVPEALSKYIIPISNALSLLSAASELFVKGDPDPRLPIPLLMHYGYVASTLYLLQQAIWSETTEAEQESAEMDELVLATWLKAGEATSREVGALVDDDVYEASNARDLERMIVYGSKL